MVSRAEAQAAMRTGGRIGGGGSAGSGGGHPDAALNTGLEALGERQTRVDPTCRVSMRCPLAAGPTSEHFFVRDGVAPHIWVPGNLAWRETTPVDPGSLGQHSADGLPGSRRARPAPEAILASSSDSR
jgi:hypothetical protein